MAAWMAASRHVASLSRLSSSTITTSAQASKLIQRRGLSGGGDHHGPPRVDFWKDPMSPSKWKEEHFVIVSLTGWGCLFYGGYKFFTKGKDEKQEKFVIVSLTGWGCLFYGGYKFFTKGKDEKQEKQPTLASK
ncbi:1D-myo-inositol 2-amino-2-deoxy-alpha-D-glucopyranoside ligase [Thalictrum thalictroides]|uniref:1D-myo-inositol 2-amino-2-deoxy-alpha-D-glucopyranoside ligase n=1 Tax=Thalictrum thalictroides TaxID=46969 RepID=A0A7J6VVW0_THATH|nr:1D-myo-inositol 2-amino-2-deoxy-alpha-D-glucopyranoside ligase [Thalictrum thalictroides]